MACDTDSTSVCSSDELSVISPSFNEGRVLTKLNSGSQAQMQNQAWALPELSLIQGEMRKVRTIYWVSTKVNLQIALYSEIIFSGIFLIVKINAFYKNSVLLLL